MITARSLLETLPEGPTAVAMGFFDGIHRGHTKVIEKAVRAGAAHGLTPCVFTFSAPQKGGPKPVNALIQTPEVKSRILEQMGVAYMLCPPFSEFKDLTPEEFARQVLVQRFHAKLVTCGENFHFGRGASAGVEELKALGVRYGFAVEVLPLELEDGEPISSTRIREALRQGDVKKAADMLGHPYTIIAPVCHGRQLGRTLDYPTANQELPTEQILPRSGVYAALAYVDGKAYVGATNVGSKPTVGGDHILVETHLMGYEGDLYGHMLTVELYEFIRPELKFHSLEELKDAICRDADTARRICCMLPDAP